jgi:hypothetical protein
VPRRDGQGSRYERPLLGLTGRWRFSENGIGSASGNVRFLVFRIVTNDLFETVSFDFTLPETGHSPSSANDTNLPVSFLRSRHSTVECISQTPYEHVWQDKAATVSRRAATAITANTHRAQGKETMQFKMPLWNR